MALTNKSYKQYDRLSRYQQFPYYYNNKDKKYIYGTTQQLNQDTPYTVYEVKHNDTYDSLQLKFYHNPTYYWIICDFNRIRDPFEIPKVGSALKIPSVSQIEFQD